MVITLRRITLRTTTTGRFGSTELSAFEGEYRSEDAETTYRVTATERGLELWQRPNNTFDMSPVYDDGFRSGGRIVRFLRDGAGRVTELSLSIGRVYDMRFQRLPR